MANGRRRIPFCICPPLNPGSVRLMTEAPVAVLASPAGVVVVGSLETNPVEVWLTVRTRLRGADRVIRQISSLISRPLGMGPEYAVSPPSTTWPHRTARQGHEGENHQSRQGWWIRAWPQRRS